MTPPENATAPDVFGLLNSFLSPPGRSDDVLDDAAFAPRLILPTAGTLPGLARRLGGGSVAHGLCVTGRSLAQAIFINNPVSGLLLLLALLLQGPVMALVPLIGIAAANLTASVIGADAAARRQGIHGFNGALVGAAVAAFAAFSSPAATLAWLLSALLAAACTTLLIETLGRSMLHRFGVPPLTLPFCLVTWLLLAVAQALPAGVLPLADTVLLPPPEPMALMLPLGTVRGFAQVFLCHSLSAALLVLAAVAAASPLAALLGLAGGLVSSLTSLALGMDPASVALGLGSYNGVLCAIAIGGIFHAPLPASVVMALLTAIASALLAPPLAMALGVVGLPALTGPFVLATLLMLPALRRHLPALLPVALHALVTPEEHRQRHRVARILLGDLRRRLSRAVHGERRLWLLPQITPLQRRQLGQMFTRLDSDQDGSVSLEEWMHALSDRDPHTTRARLREVMASMDLDGDGRVDRNEFSELMLRLRRLAAGRKRLFTYLQPVDRDSDDRLDPTEFDRLLRSVGQPPLQGEERRRLFANTGGTLSWSTLLDRLLLI
jgi:urea transporter/Ca2+-binding EF-hand superfamily protein